MYSKEQQLARHGKIDKSAVEAAAARLRQTLREERQAEFKAAPTRPAPRPGRDGAAPLPLSTLEPQGAVPERERTLKGPENVAPEEERKARKAEMLRSTLHAPTEASGNTEKAVQSWGRGRPRKLVSDLMKEHGLSRAEAEVRASKEEALR